jgi:hypothetical protein
MALAPMPVENGGSPDGWKAWKLVPQELACPEVQVVVVPPPMTGACEAM